jgi:hypothetical protein
MTATIDLDLWAIGVVVRENKYMNLTRPEKVVAAQLMRRKGWLPAQIAETLRLTTQVVTKMLARDRTAIDIDELLEAEPDFIGRYVKPTPPPISRSEVRRLTGT